MGQGPIEVDENLAKNYETISTTIGGRGIGKIHLHPDKCVCQRPYRHIICHNCGHVMFGRVRYCCPKHTKITFLIDIANCPKCRSYEYMLSEFDITENL